MALEKIREASVQKLFIKAFTLDGSGKSLLVDEGMSVAHVCRLLADKNHVPMDPKWAVVEHLPDLFMGKHRLRNVARRSMKKNSLSDQKSSFSIFRKGIRRPRAAGGKSSTVDERLEEQAAVCGEARKNSIVPHSGEIPFRSVRQEQRRIR